MENIKILSGNIFPEVAPSKFTFLKTAALKAASPESVLAVMMLALGVLLFFLNTVPGLIFHPTVPVDFEVPLLARDRLLMGMNPYLPNDPLPYKYSPFGVFPFFLLPKDHSSAWLYYKIFCICSLLAVLSFGFRPITWKRVTLSCLGVLIAWKGISSTLFFGQLEFLILFLAVGAAILMRHSVLGTGLILGVLPWLKLPMGFLFIPFYIEVFRQCRLEKNKKKLLHLTLGIGIAGVLCAVVLPGLVFGFHKTLEHTLAWISLVKTQPKDLFEEPLNQSIWMGAVRWFRPYGADLGTRFAILLATAWVVFRLGKKHSVRNNLSEPLAWISPWILLNQVINPLGWSWGGLYALGIPLSLEKSTNQPVAIKRGLWVLVVCGFLIQQRPVHTLLGFSNWEGLFPYGSVTLYWLSLLGLTLG